MLKLYHHPLSTFSRRVRIALLEKGLDCQELVVDLARGEQRSDDYRALNPYGRVPTLVEDDFVLYESTAILAYLEGRNRRPPLAPSGLRDRARMAMHIKLCDLELTPQVGRIIDSKRSRAQDQGAPRERSGGERSGTSSGSDEDSETQEEAAPQLAEARARIESHLGILARELEDRDYLVAGCFTLAEVCYAPFLAVLGVTEVEPPAPVAAWAERVLTRDSVVRTEPAIAESVNRP